ncbi:hypothetical protein ACWEVD_26585 [Nocardia thailandica]|uniref:hypothetical protein n=1 Tax=Nocardia thailandica TaxID=257275 RepID=UPI000318CD7C|nr:hypothetical protein [Nocardia thailandica]
MDIERGNTKHGPAQDEELAHELEGTLRGNRSSRAEEWRDPEPPADDDPETAIRPDTGQD